MRVEERRSTVAVPTGEGWMSDVTDLLDRLVAGTVSLDEVAEVFRSRNWPDTPVPRSRTLADVETRALDDPEEPPEGAFIEVASYHQRHLIDLETYSVLAHAAAEAIGLRSPERGPRGGLKWWVLQDRGDPGPYAVMSLDEQGIVRRYVPGEGLVHWPSLAMYVVQGEPGARPVSEVEALQLIDQGLGAIDDGYVILARGRAPTVQPPARPAP
jgi:hypothetical protein